MNPPQGQYGPGPDRPTSPQQRPPDATALPHHPTQGMPAHGLGSQPPRPPLGQPIPGPPPQGYAHGAAPQGHPQAPGGHQGPPGPSSQGFGPPNHNGRPRPQVLNAVLALAAVAVVALVCGLSIEEDGRVGWDTVNAWGAVAILGAVLTAVPALLGGTLTPLRAWQVSAGGAGALVLFWILLVLPGVGSNTSLASTIGVAAGATAAWIAPGRPGSAAGPSPAEHSW